MVSKILQMSDLSFVILSESGASSSRWSTHLDDVAIDDVPKSTPVRFLWLHFVEILLVLHLQSDDYIIVETRTEFDAWDGIDDISIQNGPWSDCLHIWKSQADRHLIEMVWANFAVFQLNDLDTVYVNTSCLIQSNWIDRLEVQMHSIAKQ